MLDHVAVDAYGEKQPLTALAQISLKNPTLFVVSPFDTAVRHDRCG
jgi:ribosome recycling factor